MVKLPIEQSRFDFLTAVTLGSVSGVPPALTIVGLNVVADSAV
jgi:hypothetical protein